MSYISSRIIRASLLPSVKNGPPLTRQFNVLALGNLQTDGRVLMASLPLAIDEFACAMYTIQLPPNSRIAMTTLDANWQCIPY